LLGDSRCTAFPSIAEVLVKGVPDFFPIESVMMKETGIFGRDHGVLQMW
jgi:hypothetical protein